MATKSGPQTLRTALRRARCPTTRPAGRSIATAAAAQPNETEPYIPDAVSTPSAPLGKAERKRAVRGTKPFSDFLTDTFARQHDYLRISVTERCNLRCLYCMPEEGIQLSPNKANLTTAEVYYLSALFVNQGVNKIRLTGGEPTVRKDIVPLMQQIGSLRRNGLKELALTTNGISLHRKLDQMVEAGLTGVNISLDTLDPFQFQLLTRRQGFDAVIKSITRVQEMNKLGAGIKLKINCVAMRGLNDHQILPFVEMTRDQDVEVRFIEYMPFGGNKWSQNKMLPYAEMLDMIREKYPTVTRMKDAKNDTSKTWHVPGFKGRVGFITSMTHNFCGSCNRLRITSDGNLKVCLHGNTEVSLRDLLRQDQGGEPMDEAAFDAIRQIELDRRKHSGLSFDGAEGWLTKERQLLDVIGAAVKRKAEKHAGMGELENMTNRPMILIGGPDAQQKSGFASSFGFQSLSGLFQQPPQGRYSRPREAEPKLEMAEQYKEPATIPVDRPAARGETTSSPGETSFFRPSGVLTQSSSQPLLPNIHAAESAVASTSGQSAALPPKDVLPDVESGSPTADKPQAGRHRRLIRVYAGAERMGERHTLAQGESSRRRPNPFGEAAAAHTVGRTPSKPRSVQSPWGLSEEDVKTLDSITDPSASTAPVLPTSGPKVTAKASNNDESRLTHVTSSGEAHMVDVGAKAASRRIAIATAYVAFHNPDPFRLIFENNNKKGDVLGVARIAGIMAAKRTSDMIPLCHPLAISKVEVDVKLEAPGTSSSVPRSRNGVVGVMAQVQCVGPTGVEMEALTAATGAALTVYDMCKAVDRKMHIGHVVLRYKSGGKSGLYCERVWAMNLGRAWFAERGLEVPEFPKAKSGDSESVGAEDS
ncbi:hypothetical protein LTR85_000226 [Meristemomyces frigidus]|nr:hypothetical protein LTR85_000226 [Meristemomyces frigidus]